MKKNKKKYLFHIKKSRKKKYLFRFFAELRSIAALFYVKFFYKNKNRSVKQTLQVVLFIMRAWDLELLLPLYHKARNQTDINVELWLSQKSFEKNPEVITYLKNSNAQVKRIAGNYDLMKVSKWLWNIDCFLTTVESTASKHKLSYVITKLANRLGINTFVMQHGFETIGLTYYDKFDPPNIKFASKKVLIWGPVKKLPAWVPSETKNKAVAVGCTKIWNDSNNAPILDENGRPYIGIFENLHWHRYNDAYRAAFLSHLVRIAGDRPELHFILKSHPISVTRRSKAMLATLQGMKNVEISDLSAQKSDALTTSSLIKSSLGIITTPSTIALDGAMTGVPVAVTRYGLDLGYYSPLPQIDELKDWHEFLDALLDDTSRNDLKLRARHFLENVILPGDAASRILEYMKKCKK